MKTNLTPEVTQPSKRRINWTKVIVAIVSALASIGAAAFAHGHFYPSEKGTNPVGTAEQLTYVGRVVDDTGQAIFGASVIAAQDQNIGQQLRSDSNGQFQIQLPLDTKSLRLTVDAAGFTEVKIQANVHRTGTEEIYLHAVPVKRAEVSPARHLLKKAADAVPTSSPAPPTALQPNQGIINSGINNGIQSVCAPGVVNCDQSVHVNDLPPAPQAFFSQLPLPVANNKSNGTQQGFRASSHEDSNDYPGVRLQISVARFFENPSFDIDCDAACDISQPFLGRASGSMFSEHNIATVCHGMTPEQMHHRIVFEDKLAPGAFISLQVRSLSPKPVSVTFVRSTPSGTAICGS